MPKGACQYIQSLLLFRCDGVPEGFHVSLLYHSQEDVQVQDVNHSKTNLVCFIYCSMLLFESSVSSRAQ